MDYSLWMPQDIAVAFVASPRVPSYLAQTLASFALSDKDTTLLREVVVSVDSDDLECAGELHGVKNIRWVPRTQEETARIATFLLHRKACHSYWRTLGLASTLSGAKAVLVCEDDIVFKNGWVGMLIDSMNEMAAHGIRKYILAAYSAHDHERPDMRLGRFYSRYLADSFFGTQAILYPSSEIHPVREIIWRAGIISHEAPYDLLIKRRAVELQHLYTTRHSLVQHVGKISTGLGGGHHSPSYIRDWPGREMTAESRSGFPRIDAP